MIDDKLCPLCNKPKGEGNYFCWDCWYTCNISGFANRLDYDLEEVEVYLKKNPLVLFCIREGSGPRYYD